MPTLTPYPSISKFQQFVELKDFRPPTSPTPARPSGSSAALDLMDLMNCDIRGPPLLLKQKALRCADGPARPPVACGANNLPRRADAGAADGELDAQVKAGQADWPRRGGTPCQKLIMEGASARSGE